MHERWHGWTVGLTKYQKVVDNLGESDTITINDTKIMPCRCEEPLETPARTDAADKATRAACDMRTIILTYAPQLSDELTVETRKWIKKHDEEDAKRIAEENANGIREQARQRGLQKLTLEERRALGL